MYELAEIMRQKEDGKFAQLLNHLREGNHTKNDIACLKARLMENVSTSDTYMYPSDKTHMFITNASVNAHNHHVFENSSYDKAKIQAIDIIVGDVSDTVKEKMKAKIPTDVTKTMGLHAMLFIAVETKYDLTANIDVTDGMTNGTECVLTKID